MNRVRTLAIIGLVLFSLYAALSTGLDTYTRLQRFTTSDDFVSKWQERVLRTLDHIPADVVSIGYVADWDLPGVQYGVIDQDNEYMLTQYALAPRRVERGLEHEWIIGNFTSANFQTWLDENLTSYTIRDVKLGIYVIHRTFP